MSDEPWSATVGAWLLTLISPDELAGSRCETGTVPPL